ncbi:uncharacterized protein EMH_0041900 [Eimeria mitis]|uniref:Uncharacterized protein n=1 Tax=Eimeria mitis TaxID=44415 RepID=U6K372_9EIME|nr:uncharacterized protein EMH_0041900 [Eimeria mitis]CDJ30777.1 hypothetical protein, conserved [Eimeria mitis]
MRSLCGVALAAALICAEVEGGMLDMDALSTVDRRGQQADVTYPGFPHSTSPLTVTFGADDLRHHDSTLPYFPVGSAGYGERASTPQREPDVKLTSEKTAEEANEALQRVDPALAIRHIAGIKTILLSTVFFCLSLLGGMRVPDDFGFDGEYGLDGGSSIRFKTTRSLLFGLVGIGTGLLVLGLAELLQSFRKINAGNLSENPRPRLRGFTVFLAMCFVIGAFRHTLARNPELLSFLYGVETAGIGLFIATVIQLLDYTLKYTTPSASSKKPNVAADATAPPNIASTSYLQTNPAGHT